MIDTEVLKEKAEFKEKELRELQTIRITSLENALKEKTSDYDVLIKQFKELKSDFIYNLELLTERDKELTNLDKKIEENKVVLREKENLIHNLKLKINEFNNTVELEKKWTIDMKEYFENKLKEKDLFFEQYKCEREKEIGIERIEMENLKRNLQREIIEMQEEISQQENDIKECYEENLNKRDHDHRLEIDQLKNNIFANDLKVRMLTKQLDVLKEARECGDNNLQAVQSEFSELENNLKKKDFEIQDIKAMTSAKLLELEEKLKNAEKLLEKRNNELERKHSEIINLNEEHKSQILKLEELNGNLETESQKEIKKLVEKNQDELRRTKFLEINFKKISEESQLVIQKLSMELEKSQSEFNREINQFLSQQTQNDLEMNKVKAILSELREELRQKNKDILNYQEELTKNLNQISILNRQNKQLCVDFQHQVEKMQFNKSNESENVIKTLTDSKEEALIKISHLQAQLEALQKYTTSLTEEKDNLKAMAKNEAKTVKSEVDDVKQVEMMKENDELKQVVKMMRAEMESILESKNLDAQKQELDDLKFKYKSLMDDYKKLEKIKSNTEDVSHPKKSHDEIAFESNIADNMQVAAHVEDLNKQLGELRKEKMTLTSQICKHQSRILHLENLLDSDEPKKKQTEIEQLQYELNSLRRRTDSDQLNLKQRINDLELQLVDARNEADEFYKENVQANNEITRLSNQISRLKLDSASKNQQIGFGAQELVIQQLHDELKLLHTGRDTLLDAGQHSSQLEQALNLIQQLEKEKQILVELSNKLKAQLKASKRSDQNDAMRPKREIRNYILVDKLKKPDSDANERKYSKHNVKDILGVSYKASVDGSTTSTLADDSEMWKMLDSNSSNLSKKNQTQKTTIPVNEELSVKGVQQKFVSKHSYKNIPRIKSTELPFKQKMLQQRINTYVKKI